jgi:hypothetical protein
MSITETTESPQHTAALAGRAGTLMVGPAGGHGAADGASTDEMGEVLPAPIGSASSSASRTLAAARSRKKPSRNDPDTQTWDRCFGDWPLGNWTPSYTGHIAKIGSGGGVSVVADGHVRPVPERRRRVRLARIGPGCHPYGSMGRLSVARRHLKAGTSRRGALQNAAALQLPTSRSRCCRISRRRRSSRWRTNIEKTGEDAYRLTMAVAERRMPGGCAVDATCRIEQAEQTIRKGSDNQIDRARVLEVRIQSPPAVSLSRQ